MVSLNRGENSSSGGGVFFSDSSLHSSDSDTNQLLHAVVGRDVFKQFTPLSTIPAAIFILLLGVLMEVLVIVFTLYWTNNDKCEPYFFTLYSHIIYWTITFVVDFYVKRKHYESRIRGYLDFHLETRYHYPIPLYITSIWNATLLAVETVFHQQYGDLTVDCGTRGSITPMYYMCFVITLENLVMFPVIITYVRKVSRFNKQQARPDVLLDDWMTTFVRNSYSEGEVGYRESDNHVVELLERQAEIFLCLKEQNSRFVNRIFELSSQLQERRSELVT